MSHTDIIILVITFSISSTLGVYALIRCINQHTRPPVNTLVRSGDIELVDYIEPSQPDRIYQYPDLLEQQQFPRYIYERAPSYWSGTPPSYQTTDRLYINSCLENSIYPDLIFWLILFGVLVIIITILIRKMGSN